jgi:dimethylamine/trimethylamine dehydrogenase
MWNGRIICTQNPTIGEEFRRAWHPEEFSLATNRDESVLVVGAGPAGLETAMVLGKRGFEMVHLVDAAAEVGGSLDWITRLPGRREWRHVIEYRAHQLAKLKNVTTILNTSLSADDILNYGADIVVVATGSSYSADDVSPYDRSRVDLASFTGTLYTPEQVMAAKDAPPLGKRVLVWDTDGYFVGPGVAEHLAALGHEVIAATPAASLGQYLGYTMESSQTIRDLRQLGVTLHTHSAISAATADQVTLSTLNEPVEVGIDSIVVVGQRVAHSDLYLELLDRRDEWEESGLSHVYRVGDSVRPSFIADAIFSGHRLAREIDTPDPDQPLPYIRERRLVNASEVDFTFTGPALSREV